jgi:hypothetical protein
VREDGRWSAAGILEHLSLTYGGTAYAMEKAFGKGMPIGKPATVGQKIIRLMVVGIGYFPRVEAPEPTRPRGLPAAEARRALIEKLAEMDTALAEAERRFGPRALVANHPVMGGFTVARWRRFHLQHTRHHARQIRARLR